MIFFLPYPLFLDQIGFSSWQNSCFVDQFSDFSSFVIDETNHGIYAYMKNNGGLIKSTGKGLSEGKKGRT